MKLSVQCNTVDFVLNSVARSIGVTDIIVALLKVMPFDHHHQPLIYIGDVGESMTSGDDATPIK